MNLNQHFLYTYSNTYSYAPNDLVKETFKNDLIFDITRRSIHTQNTEFGYIANIDKEIVARTGDDTDYTYLRLVIDKGYVNFTQYIPASVEIAYMNLAYESAYEGNVVELGSTVYLNSCYVAIRGNNPLLYINFSFTNFSTAEHEFSNDSELINEIINPGRVRNIRTSFVSSFMGTLEDGTDSRPVFSKLTTPDIHEFIVSTIDSRMSNRCTYKEVFYSSNHAMLMEFGDEDHASYYSIMHAIQDNESLDVVEHEVLIDHLIDDYRINTYTTPYRCKNGSNRFLGLYFPKRLYDEDVITGILNGGATQEFNKICSLAYTNGADFTEDYNLYLARGENWVGSSLQINSMI